MHRLSQLFLIVTFIFCFAVGPAYAAEPGFVSGTGQFVTTLTSGADTASGVTTAANQALTRYKANGGTTPKLILFFHNLYGESDVLPSIKSVFGTTVQVAGMDTSWGDYTPLSLDVFPDSDTKRSIVVMVLGGSSVSFSSAIGATDFSSTDNTVLAVAGTKIAQGLTPDPNKKNLVLLFGPLHYPNNVGVVQGMQQKWGKPLPQSIKILGWAGPYWGASVYQNSLHTAGGSTAMAVMMTGDFQWSFSGIQHDINGWGVSNDAPTEIARETQLVSTAVGGKPGAIFMVLGHPDRSLFPTIRTAIANVVPTNTPLLGGHVGSETGHDTTAGDVIPDGSHFFVAAISSQSGAGTPVPTPTPTPSICRGDINGDRIVDISDYSLLVKNFFKSPLLNAAADLNGDTIVDISDYSLFVSSFFNTCP